MAAARSLGAQQKTMPVVGYFNGTTPEANAPHLAAFRQGLSETGWVEGQNLKIEYRWAEFHYDRLPRLAADLVSHKVDVIAACGGADEAFVAKDATSTIPTVFNTGADPVETGLAASLARPGGNSTGVTPLTQPLWQKRLSPGGNPNAASAFLFEAQRYALFRAITVSAASSVNTGQRRVAG